MGSDETITIGQNRRENVGASENISIAENQTIQVGNTQKVYVGDLISITCGASSLKMYADGTILLEGINVQVKGSNHVDILGEFVDIN